jgi:hypothetical protein
MTQERLGEKSPRNTPAPSQHGAPNMCQHGCGRGFDKINVNMTVTLKKSTVMTVKTLLNIFTAKVG